MKKINKKFVLYSLPAFAALLILATLIPVFVRAAEVKPETKLVSVVKEDAYVRGGGNADKNYNFEDITSAHGAQYVGKDFRVINIKHKTGNEIMALMKFTLPTKDTDEKEKIDTYTLELSVFKNADYNNGNQDYIFCYTTDNSWSETGVTWNSLPSSVVRDSKNRLGVLSVVKGDEYETKADGDKVIKMDITETVKALINQGKEEITVFAYAENDLETSLLIHSKETSDENKRARIVGVCENIGINNLKSLVGEAAKKKQSDYTSLSWKSFKEAYDTASAVAAKSAPKSLEIINAYKALDAAMNTLVVVTGNNLAYGRTARSNLNKTAVSRITDGNPATHWSGAFYPSYVDVDLEDNYDIDKIVVRVPVGKKVYFTLYGSTDGENYSRIYQLREFKNESTGVHEISFSKPQRLRIIRVYMEYTYNEDGAYLSELEAYGKSVGGNSTPLRTGSLEEILEIKPFDKTDYAKPITVDETIENVYGIIDRTVGSKYRDWFSFEIKEGGSDKDYFTLEDKDGKILITGNEGLSLTMGLNYYYKNYLNVHISEQTKQVKMPSSIVKVGLKLTKETDFDIRYAYNYCTLSYTFAFFDKDDWQRELDWLALNGVNIVLDLAGQEAVWIKFLMNYGYSFDDAKDWLTGPCYYAWQFMDNMETFGGPVPDGYIVDRVEMARSTQRWKNSLGMQTILQGYAGMVPTNFNEFQPSIKTIAQGGWNGFTRPSMIATNSKEYDELAAMFYSCQEFVYGRSNHYYAVDPFHEGGTRPAGLGDADISKNVMESLLKYDPEAVWVIQGWQSNPTSGLLQGLGSYKNTNALIVDLIKYPISTGTKYDDKSYGSTTLAANEFNGTNWVWGLLANFGGNPSMHGQLKAMVEDILKAKKTSSYMKGIGIISEGQYDNPVVYDLLFEMVNADDSFDLDTWLEGYISRRYGGTSENVLEAWKIMKDANYSQGVRFTNEVYGTKNKGPQGYTSQAISYGAKKLENALKLLISDFDKFKDSECYLYDLTELMRQVVSNYSTSTYNDLLIAKNDKNLNLFVKYKDKFMASLLVLNEVQATQKEQLAGEWIGKAQDMAAKYDDFASDAFEMNAKALISSWGSRSANRSLKDYGWRNYEGMFLDIYAAVWEEYLDSVEQNLKSGRAILNKSIDDYFDMYWRWNLSKQSYTRVPKSSPEDILAVSQKVLSTCMTGSSNSADAGNIAGGRPVAAGGSVSGSVGSAVDKDGGTSVTISAANGKKPELTVDLIAEFDLSSVSVIFGGEYSYGVYVSVDGREWKLIYTGASKKGSTETIKTDALSARYIKIRVTGDSSFVINEIRAYGERTLPDLSKLESLVDTAKKLSLTGASNLISAFNAALADAEKAIKDSAPPDDVNGVYWALYDAIDMFDLYARENLAKDKKVTAHNDPSGNSARLTDGDYSTSWDSGRLSPTGKPYQDEIVCGEAVVDLGKLYYLDEIIITFGSSNLWYKYELYVSADNSEWTQVGKKSDTNTPTAGGDIITFRAIRARYIKLVTTDIAAESDGRRAGYLVSELQAFGSENEPTFSEADDTYSVIATVRDKKGGSVSPDYLTVKEGESVTLTFTPEEGFTLYDVLINGKSAISKVVDNTLVIENITFDMEIEAVFSDHAPATNEKGSIAPTIIAVCAAVIALAAVGVGVFIAVKKRKAK